MKDKNMRGWEVIPQAIAGAVLKNRTVTSSIVGALTRHYSADIRKLASEHPLCPEEDAVNEVLTRGTTPDHQYI